MSPLPTVMSRMESLPSQLPINHSRPQSQNATHRPLFLHSIIGIQTKIPTTSFFFLVAKPDYKKRQLAWLACATNSQSWGLAVSETVVNFPTSSQMQVPLYIP